MQPEDIGKLQVITPEPYVMVVIISEKKYP